MKVLLFAISTSIILVTSAQAETLLRGHITFQGKVPAPKKELVSKDVEHCGHGYRETQEVRIDNQQGLQDVVIYLDSTELEFNWTHPQKGYSLTQQGCRFEPLIQIYPKDPKVRLKVINNDPLLHNVRIDQLIDRLRPTLLNLSQPEGQAPKSKGLRIKPGSNIIEISCDVHSFMKGWMFAADNPYCTLVDEHGAYTIKNLPTGEHTFKAWHPYLGTQEAVATIEDGKPITLNFTFEKKDTPKAPKPSVPNEKPMVKVPETETVLAPLSAFKSPEDNPMTPQKIELGKMLFFDTRASGDGSLSCSSCHNPDTGWGDGGELSRGYPGTRNWRNAPTIINAAYLSHWFWTGDATTMEDQAHAALTGPIEGNGDPKLVEARLAQIPEYVQRFKEVFGTNSPRYKDLLRAVTTFERTLIQRDTPYDQYLNGEYLALEEEERRGLELFRGKANCIHCHKGELLTDQDFHSLGLPENPLFSEDPLVQITLRLQNRARGHFNPDLPELQQDQGLYYRTQKIEDIGKFRTAPLRYTLYTPPYMHNGVFNTLSEVVDFYNKGGGDGPNKHPEIKPLNLSADEQADLVSFLEALSGVEIKVEAPELPEYGVLPRD